MSRGVPYLHRVHASFWRRSVWYVGQILVTLDIFILDITSAGYINFGVTETFPTVLNRSAEAGDRDEPIGGELGPREPEAGQTGE